MAVRSPRRVLGILSAFIVLVAPAHGADSRDFTVTLQNDGDYVGASDDGGGDALMLSVNRDARISNSIRIHFGDLQDFIRGERVEVLDARLELYYRDETWTLVRYRVAALPAPEAQAAAGVRGRGALVTIVGDKWPHGTKTPLKSWVSLPIDARTVERWLANEESNRGLVLAVDSAEFGPEGEAVDLSVAAGSVKGPFISFGSNAGPRSQRPRLVVHYRVHGNIPPAPPSMHGPAGPGSLASPAELDWAAVVDPDTGRAAQYQFQAGYRSGGEVEWAGPVIDLPEPRTRWDLSSDRERLYGELEEATRDAPLWYRLRSVDAEGAASRWVVAGPFHAAENRWSVWILDGNRKVWFDAPVPRVLRQTLRIHAARNEWEPFQVAVAAHGALRGLHLKASKLAGPDGAELGAPAVFRQHYLPIEETANSTYGRLGLVPDALVPVINPVSGQPTSGLYGGDRFDLHPGGRETFWLDAYVPADSPPGLYRGTVTVTADALPPVELEVELQVWDFQLPAKKSLVACFQMDEGSVARSHEMKAGSTDPGTIRMLARRYEAMLHEHYISNWSPITGFNYGLNGVKVSVVGGKVTTDWREFDALVTPYMDGSAFDDGVPSQCLFVPYWLPATKRDGSGWAPRVNRFNYENIRFDLFEQFIGQAQEHLEAKGWLDRAYVFYFDEPFISKWKYEAYLNTAKAIRRAAPKLRILLTDGYRGPEGYEDLEYIREPIEPYVDVWNPVTFQVSSPELAEFYRERKRAGKFDMWCQTLANANPRRGVINLFPEFDMPFHRMWGTLSWSLGFQGIEWWQTIVWWDPEQKRRIDPWTDAGAFPGFRQPLNGDGRLFYPGSARAVGGPEIPVSTLRMKAVREAIEDYEYLQLLADAGGSSGFDLDTLYTFDRASAERMSSPMPMGKGPWHWWEGDPDTFMAARTEIAGLILRARAGATPSGR